MKITPIQLAKRVEKWGQRLAPLGVSHWRIERVILTDDIDSYGRNASAGVSTSDFYDDVTWHFQNEWLENCTEQELDETIIHEWLHVAWRDLAEVQKRVRTWMPYATFNDHTDAVRHETEGLVDRLSRAMYHLYAGDKPHITP
jgi:hypothetical protein